MVQLLFAIALNLDPYTPSFHLKKFWSFQPYQLVFGSLFPRLISPLLVSYFYDLSLSNHLFFFFFFFKSLLHHSLILEKNVSLQVSLKKNPSNFIYIFLLDINFENLTFRLHALITSSILTKF